MAEVSLAVAFVAGLLSFFSPCILPLLPAYFTYLGGSAVAGGRVQDLDRSFLAGRAALFTAGFALIFILLGASAGGLGYLLQAYRPVVNRLGGILIIVFGLQVAGIGRLPFLAREKKWELRPRTPGAAASFLLGMAFAAGWTPCIGPVLASILIYAGSQATLLQGMLLLATYSLGLALPFLVAALALGPVLHSLRKFSRYMPQISLISGFILVAMGLLVFFGRLNAFI
ncbi:cytochrome c biogenesis CcdA family protein [Moorella sp. Hama-1]|uniref:cytochrome c biogenesis CcdA family protein n=1 Tax=Moorella sp. Hama-1 TaxID=2138101 RepID=UPI000D65B1F6|nr:cytochrome c biogenesis protein CcdA [Moorella sp. Hama-1]MDN5361347.1 cytochrome c-type biosis protein [Moorella sp. (in: firmicutes)]BCV22112.1 cytochrome C biogenesis protein CcdA [Moorella sp. Hama-1]